MTNQAPHQATLYERLGVEINAADDVIRAAYIRLAKEWHPDRHRGGDCGVAQRRFQDVQEAYEILMHSERRSAYDLQLLHLLDSEEYVARFRELVLTVNGLGMAPPRPDGQPLSRRGAEQPEAGPEEGPEVGQRERRPQEGRQEGLEQDRRECQRQLALQPELPRALAQQHPRCEEQGAQAPRQDNGRQDEGPQRQLPPAAGRADRAGGEGGAAGQLPCEGQGVQERRGQDPGQVDTG